MGRLDQTPRLPINLDRAIKIYPSLESTAKDLERLSVNYQEADFVFWGQLADLFTGPDDLAPAGDRAWSTLLSLRNLAREGRLTADLLFRLEHNNSRAVLACDMLSIIFKT